MTVSHIYPKIGGAYKPEPYVRRKPKPSKGYKLEHRPGPKGELSESEVREMRWMYDYGGWSLKQVQDHWGLAYHKAYMLIVVGSLRSKIVPKPDDFPNGHTPAPMEKS